jgi:hypothetical protein
VSTIQFNNHTVNILNGTTVFLGESVTLTGTLHDNLDQRIDSSVPIFTNSFSELTNNLRVVGWNGTHEIGIAQVASPNANGAYEITYQIPYNYSQDELTIRMNITSSGLVHYRVNYTQTPIYIYWDFQIADLEIFFSSNDTSVELTEGGQTYFVYGENNRDITIRGNLTDSSDRGLRAKWINTTWNNSISPPPHPVLADPAGSFTLDYSFTGYESGFWIWKFYHILDNGTELSKSYNVTLNWVVYDTTGPIIEVTSPVESLLSPTNTVIILAIVTEAAPPTYEVVSSELDNSSVTIQINGVNNTMSQVAGEFIFSYNWDTSDAIDIIYTITIFASDIENNWNSATFNIIIDVVAPTGTIDVSENPNGYLNVDSNGIVSISGTLEDDSSITGSNSGMNETTVHLAILNPSNKVILYENLSTVTVMNDSFSYDWIIILDLDTFDRDTRFKGFEDWTINVTFRDIAGNEGYIAQSVKLDNNPPSLEFVGEIPEEVDKKLTITVSYEELETDIYIETLAFEILNSTGHILRMIRYGDADLNITETDSQVSLVLDTSDIPKGVYTIKVLIRDKTGNLRDRTSDSFTISHPTPPNPFTNIILLLISPILAFGGGIGLAAVYERIRGLRGA